MRKLIYSQLLVGSAALVFPCAAFAQGADDSSSASSEIIVTAQRRAEALQDVPISITALTNDTLVKSGIQEMRDLQTIAPALKVSSTGVFMQLSIRGITSTALGPGIENNIALYIDGFYQPSSTGLGGDFANVQGVQILKGPQGTLYGRNATGGAMLISTMEPNSDAPSLDFTVGYGNLNEVRARSYASVPITDNLSFGVGAYYRVNDGYIKDSFDGHDAAPYKYWEIRNKLKFEPSSDVTLTLGYNHYYRSDGKTFAYNFSDNTYLGFDFGPNFGFPVPPVGPLRAQGEEDVSSLTFDSTYTSELDEFTGKLEWSSDFGTLTSYTSYSEEASNFDNDYDGTKLPYQRYDAWWYRKTFIQAVDLNTKPVEGLDVTVGAMYYHDNSTQDAQFYFGSQNIVAFFGDAIPLFRAETPMKTRAWAAYLDATWEVADNLYFNAGIRYSHDKRTIFSEYTQDNPPNYPIGPRIDLTGVSYNSWTPRATLRYEFAPDMNVYASFSQGFKSGTFNSTGSNPEALTTPVRPEKVNSYELGLKGVRNGIYFDVAGYYYDYKDLQVNAVQTFVEGGVQRTATLLTNAATAEIYGLEASVNAPITDRFNIRAGGAYTHARYKKFDNAPVNIPVNGRVVATVQDSSGLRIARAPDWTFSIGADYTIPVGEGEVVLAGNGYYSSKYAPQNEAIDPATGEYLYYQDGYFQANASIDWHLPGDKLILGVWMNNITDKRYYIITTSNAQGTYHVNSPPRTYGVKFGAKF